MPSEPHVACLCNICSKHVASAEPPVQARSATSAACSMQSSTQCKHVTKQCTPPTPCTRYRYFARLSVLPPLPKLL